MTAVLPVVLEEYDLVEFEVWEQTRPQQPSTLKITTQTSLPFQREDLLKAELSGEELFIFCSQSSVGVWLKLASATRTIFLQTRALGLPFLLSDSYTEQFEPRTWVVLPGR